MLQNLLLRIPRIRRTFRLLPVVKLITDKNGNLVANKRPSYQETREWLESLSPRYKVKKPVVLDVKAAEKAQKKQKKRMQAPTQKPRGMRW